MFDLKLLLFVLLLISLWFIAVAATRGRRLAHAGYTLGLVEQHRKSTTRALFAMLLAIGLLEIMVHVPALQAHPASPGLLYFHLFFAVLFFLSFLALKFWLTGERVQQVHRWLTYACLACFAVALPTGLVMLYQL